MAIWYLQRLDDGTFIVLPRTKWEPFFFRNEPLSGARGEFVFLVEVAVGLENRKPTEIHRMLFVKKRIRADGRLDKDYQFEATRALLESMPPFVQESPEGVVNATHRFAQRQREHLSNWKPSAADLHALAAAINQRAGRRLM